MGMNQIHFIHEKHERLTYRTSWFQLVRPMTFTGTVSPVLAGTALAYLKGPVRLDLFFAIIIAGLFVQFSMNMLNDYLDYQKGQDHEKWVRPGDPLFGKGPNYHTIPYVATVLILITIGISIWIASQSTYWILAVGGFGFLIGLSYSAGPRPLCSIALGEIDAAICMGIVPGVLSYIIQGHRLDIEIIAVIVPFMFLIFSMILSNNIRDLEKDKGIRKTLPMFIGRVRASQLLTILLSLAYLWVITLVSIDVLPLFTVAVILALPLAYRLNMSYKPGANRSDEVKGMNRAALHHMGFGFILAASLWLSSF
ncbi:prenyltransferase [Bacillus sp. REN16]|uniref:prenyltransferase n=1 Tax=Bacillus sp. REN16 TaxID=2887296 RepID=UPI001E45D95C|nr:prenyltransferase [Bacillus sp. REN16]MCC3357933.1 prenyltransferase [Bacillus sp. REN16]